MNTYPISLNTFLITLVLIITLLGVWEYAARRMGYEPWLDDDKHLWAEQRAKAEKTGPEDVVLTGSSRVLFDIQLDEWEQETGRRPIMLALPGSSPLPVVKDIVERSTFAGTMIIGVTPPLYFSPPMDTPSPWHRAMEQVNHYHKRTLAERFGHWLSLPLQRTFAFLRNEGDTFYNDLDLATLVKRVHMKHRVLDHPPFPCFGNVDRDRNMTMIDRTVTDTAYANMIKRVWGFFGQQRPSATPEQIEQLRAAILGMSAGLVKQFEARGGKVIFVRCPSQGPFFAGENMGMPRATYWDELLKATGCPGYYFEDYEFMNKYTLPEWSHLSAPDAKTFTRDLVRQMKQDGVL
ncbi:MAG TPA: hypothetical protein VI603_03615 [Saprospiraceae bacterium]|nr:hypothetical protein [Saprospiraceae bacterium]